MFSRFKALEGFGEKELKKLKNSKVAVVGVGATGSVIAEHLGRHGVELLIIDRDYLEKNDSYSSNIYTPKDCEKSLPKAAAAEKYLSKFTKVESKVESLNPENIGLLKGVDLIIDGTDNIDARLLINEFSKKGNIPWIYTAAISDEGYSMFFQDKCFNCVFGQLNLESLESCETAGILREASAIAASYSARKAVRYLTGKKVEENLEKVSGERFEVENPGCEICEAQSYTRLNGSRKTIAVCGEKKYQVEKELTEESFERVRELGQKILENDYLLRAEVDNRNITLFRSGRIILEAEDKGHAEATVSELGL